MFEYAISAGEGTLLDYGTAHATALNCRLGFEDYPPSVYFYESGDVVYSFQNNSEAVIRPACGDCATGQ